MIWPAVSNALVEKWEFLLPPNARNKPLLARLMENQEKCFNWMGKTWPNKMPSGPLLEAIGEDWRHKVMRAIAHGLNLSPLHDMVSVQPLDGPIGYIMRQVANNDSHRSLLPLESDEPFIPFRLEPMEIRAETRKSRLRIDPLPKVAPLQEFTEQVFGQDKFQRELNGAFELFFLEEIVREVLGTILNAAEFSDRAIKVADPDRLMSAIHEARAEIHRAIGRSPDWCITGPLMSAELARQQRQFPAGTVYEDPAFPPCKFLLFTSPRGVFDGDVIYSPYYFEFDDGYSGPNGPIYGLRVRHKITVVSVEGSYVVELE